MSATAGPDLLLQVNTLLPDDPAEALALIDKGMGAQPFDTRLSELRARALLSLGRAAEARSQIDRLLADRPGSVNFLVLLARAAAQMGDGRACRAACRRILMEHPGHSVAHRILAQSLAEDGRVADALQHVDLQLRHAPDDPEALRRRAQLLWQDGRTDEAIAFCRTVLARLPDARALRLWLTDALAQGGDPAAALAELAPVLAEAPEDVGLMLRMVRFLRTDGQHAAARHHAELGCAAHPRDIRLWRELALLCRQTGHLREGLAACDSALALDPHHPGARQERVDLLIQQGDLARVADLAREAAYALASGGADPTAARILCRAATCLPGEDLRGPLRQAVPGLLANAAELPAELLWQTCLRASLLGLGTDLTPLLADLLARPRMDLALARTLVMQAFARGQADWPQLVAPLTGRLAPDERAFFLCEVEALQHGALAALALRPRDPRCRGPRWQCRMRLILLAPLLRQTGRVRLAARHQRLVLRSLPLDPTLFRLHFTTLLQAGRPAEARALLRRVDASERGPRWRMIVAQSWGELDQPERACRIVAQSRAEGVGTAGDIWYPRCLLRLGRVAEARALFDRQQGAGAARRGIHFGPSVEGMMQMEAELAAGETSGSVDRLVSAAIRRIAGPSPEHSGPAPTEVPIPPQIMQYWDQTLLPRDIVPIVGSWAGLRGYHHQRFDRMSARQFLDQRLGRDWRGAFDKARSATEESDFFRLCWLAVEGGIYADCDDWRIGHPRHLLSRGYGLIALREPVGALANNFIAAPPRHPALVWAAVAARRALDQRHNDSVWSKTGPGLLTRAAAWYLDDCARKGLSPALTILPQYMAGLVFDQHVPLTYKSTDSYWNATRRAGPSLPQLIPLLAASAESDAPILP